MIIAKTKRLNGCDSILPAEPVKLFEVRGTEFIETNTDLSKCLKCGENKDFEFYLKNN